VHESNAAAGTTQVDNGIHAEHVKTRFHNIAKGPALCQWIKATNSLHIIPVFLTSYPSLCHLSILQLASLLVTISKLTNVQVHMAVISCLSPAARCSLLLTVGALVLVLSHGAHANGGYRTGLSSSFYDSSCPSTRDIVRRVIQDARVADARIPASLIRLHFHDCFANVSLQNHA
jgi:hypothetical protein